MWPAVDMAITPVSVLKAKEAWQDPNYSYSLNNEASCKKLRARPCYP